MLIQSVAEPTLLQDCPDNLGVVLYSCDCFQVYPKHRCYASDRRSMDSARREALVYAELQNPPHHRVCFAICPHIWGWIWIQTERRELKFFNGGKVLTDEL